ncbi:MAG: NAD(+) diphosphatase [Burkholderiales bacterium]|nr:NAD(+) diphosphatase [Burkholderiales bacterium]
MNPDASWAAEFAPAVQPQSAPSASAWCFAFHEGRLLLPGGEPVLLAPLPAASSAWPFETVARHYLGQLGGLDCWAVMAPHVPPDWQAQPLRNAMMALPEPLMLLAGRAAQVLEWDRTHRHCGACGTPTELLAGERARRCPACGQQSYPRISPAMMALVWRGRELLLARSPGFRPGVFSALAGFVEPGESLEDCVHREVAEEVGVRVKHLRYFGSQSWPFPHSLMVAFTAEWAGGDICPQPGEIEQAAWFDIDALPDIPPRFSISGHLIRDTVQSLRQSMSGT